MHLNFSMCTSSKFKLESKQISYVALFYFMDDSFICSFEVLTELHESSEVGEQ